MLRGLVSIFLALLIGNPVCCCAFSRLAPASSTSGEAVPSCCQPRGGQTPASGTDSEEEAPDPCPCTKKVGIVPTDKTAVLPPVPTTVVPPVIANENFSVGFESGHDAFLPLRKSRSEISATSPPHRLLHCVLRC